MSEGKSAATPQRSEAEFNFGQLVADLTSDIDEKICAMGRGEIRFMPADLTKLVAAHLAPICDWVKEAGSVAAPKAGEPPQELIERARAAWNVVIHPALMPVATALSYEECRAADEVIVREMANFAESELRGAGETPAERPLTQAARLAEVWLENGWDFAGLAPAIRAMAYDAGEPLPLPPGAGSKGGNV